VRARLTALGGDTCMYVIGMDLTPGRKFGRLAA
jgi:hypothetical protein